MRCGIRGGSGHEIAAHRQRTPVHAPAAHGLDRERSPCQNRPGRSAGSNSKAQLPRRSRKDSRTASRRCPSCDHPARWSVRAPGTHRRHRADPYCHFQQQDRLTSILDGRDRSCRCWVMPHAPSSTMLADADCVIDLALPLPDQRRGEAGDRPTMAASGGRSSALGSANSPRIHVGVVGDERADPACRVRAAICTEPASNTARSPPIAGPGNSALANSCALAGEHLQRTCLADARSGSSPRSSGSGLNTRRYVQPRFVGPSRRVAEHARMVGGRDSVRR